VEGARIRMKMKIKMKLSGEVGTKTDAGTVF